MDLDLDIDKKISQYSDYDVIRLCNELTDGGLCELGRLYPMLNEDWIALVDRSLGVHKHNLFNKPDPRTKYDISAIQLAIKTMSLLNDFSEKTMNNAFNYIEDITLNNTYLFEKAMSIVCQFSPKGPDFTKYVVSKTSHLYAPNLPQLRNLQERNKECELRSYLECISVNKRTQFISYFNNYYEKFNTMEPLNCTCNIIYSLSKYNINYAIEKFKNLNCSVEGMDYIIDTVSLFAENGTKFTRELYANAGLKISDELEKSLQQIERQNNSYLHKNNDTKEYTL